ncbi:MAG: aminotransferase class V-fold PLP-dependent enzyme [Candidatus Andersenbacteria bacterium]|nr:aminotransferase class V-fold PLP-dependent enzyme [Candidatus Andersenbacteria bacterium]MBI3250298.1 aminotransferase class V-fold PLP-dependent enzyme [Candidatus Andersenbacteria bacterium]
MKPIAISLSPNTTSEDVRAALRALLMSSVRENKEILEQVRRQVSQILAGRRVLLASSGRQALADILFAANIGAGDEVILQAFTCIAVPESIMWAGATPIYVDIDARTYNLSVENIRSRITPRTRAIIIQHTFGIPGPIEEIVRLGKEKNILVIEDCAVSLGALHNGQPVGTFGDISFMSFGRDKMISSVFGGAIATNNDQLFTKLKALQAVRTNPSPKWVAQQLLHPILFSLILPLYTIGIGKAILVLAQKVGLLSRAYETPEKTGGKPSHIDWVYAPALAFLAHVQLKKFSYALARRRDIARRYMNALGTLSSFDLPQIASLSEPAWLRLPVRVSDKKGFLKKAQQQGILLGDWYDGALMPGSSNLSDFRYITGSCLVAEEAAVHVINLPTYPRMNDAQVETVITFMKTYANS